MSQELLQQLHAALSLVLGGGNSGGLGFCQIPENQNAVKYLFPGYDECSIGRPPYLIALDEDKKHIPIPQPALKGKLKFLNLIDVVRAGQDTQKLEFWIDCGTRTYVVCLGWADQNGKLNNATESFLKALASLTLDELLEPFTFTLSRLVDKPSYDPSKGNAATAGKVLLTDVWKNSGESVYYEQGHMDANAACSVILRINNHLTGQAVLTPRQPKAKPQPTPQPQQQQWGNTNNAPVNPNTFTPTAPIPTYAPNPAPISSNPPSPIGGLTPDQAAQFALFQAQQAPIPTPPPAPVAPPIPQMTPEQMAQYQQFLAQQSIAQPPQWGSPAPVAPPQPTQNGNGGSKVNW